MQKIFNNIIGGSMKYLTDNYEINRDKFKADFADCSDFLLREAEVDGERAFFCAMDGLVDSLQLSQLVTQPILTAALSFSTPQEHLEKIKKCVVGAVEMSEADTFEDAYYYMMCGFLLFYLEGNRRALVFGVQGWTKRNTDEPTNEAMVKGAKECFVETLNDNKALLRKRLKTPHLKLKQLKLGKTASTPVVLAFLDDRADKKAVKLVEERLQSAPLNAVEDYGSLQPFIGSPLASFFSAVGNTERPDVFASKLLEGRVGVLVDGTPFAMYTPYLFTDNFSSFDDYDNPPFYASFTRLLKYLSFVISVTLPALYVAIGTFHQEMIPATLLYVIATSEATTPFSLLMEAVLVHILYEIMREAGLRLPKTVGHAVSIIGALVIGEAMVSAGLIGEPMLVGVALTAIASYVVYPLYESVAVLRILLILVVGVTGLYGLMLALGVLCVNICAISSLGVPYTVPLSPLTASSLGDTLFRQSWKKLARRRVRINELKGAGRHRD